MAPDHVLVGAEAVRQSRFLQRREDRRWTESDEWYSLAMAALTELTSATLAELRIVTGLPVAFFQGDKVAVRDRLLGEHRPQREGRRAQTLRVTDAHVIPQPFGALLAVTLGDVYQVVKELDRKLEASVVLGERVPSQQADGWPEEPPEAAAALDALANL